MQLFSAEIRGTVDFRFQADLKHKPVVNEIPVSIALFPLDGQALPAAGATTHQMNIANKRLDPAYITIRRGDKVQLVNEDALIHHFQAVEKTGKTSVVLAGRGKPGATGVISFKQKGRVHLFCKIHAGIYGRVDVIDTPYIKVIKGPGEFEFRNIEAGRWQVRVTAPGSDLVMEVAEAFTAPPPVNVELNLHTKNERDTSGSMMKNISRLFPR
jgi:plastocyanin